MMLNQAKALLLLTSIAVFSPTLSGLYSIVAVLIFLLGIYECRHQSRVVFLLNILVVFLLLVTSLTGLISLQLMLIGYASVILASLYPNYRQFALIFLFCITPFFQTIVLYLAGILPPMLQQAAPFMGIAIILFVIFTKIVLKILIFCFLILLSTYFLWLLNFNVLAVDFINSSIFAAFLYTIKDENIFLARLRLYASFSLLFLHCIFLFSISSSINKNNIYVWLPDAPDKFEHQFFNDYTHTLKLVGLDVKKISSSEDLRKGSVILVPWATHPESADFLSNIKKDRLADTLTVIVAGEHSNYSNFADRINPLFSNSITFENTTTIPPENSNSYGALWTASILQFPFRATINRGASLKLQSLSVVPILIAKSIFSDIGPAEVNDFWVGDFLMGHQDPRGWTLMLAAYRDGPLWILAGDNSFLLNKFLIEKPSVLLDVIAYSSLYPVLLLQISIIFLMLMVCGLQSNILQKFPLSPWLFVSPLIISLCFVIIQKIVLTGSDSNLSNKLIFFAGDERSSTTAISRLSKKIIDSDKEFFVHENGVSYDLIGKTGKEEIHIGHLKGDINTKNISIDRCGLTNYSNNNDPQVTLFEAQYCRVRGNVSVILGSSDQASIIKIETSPPVILILDKYFLSGSTPNASNLKFVEKLLD